MLSSVGKNITRLVEIFENERYSPLSGWSAKGLLLTDRKALSNHDGTDGYSNIEEANGALLSRGWEWDQEGWKVDTVLSDVDADGWSYRTDFTGFSQASTTIQTPNTESTETAIPPAPMRSSSISSAGTTGGGSAQKGFFHVVRRRRLIRQQFFSGKSSIALYSTPSQHLMVLIIFYSSFD